MTPNVTFFQETIFNLYTQ